VGVVVTAAKQGRSRSPETRLGAEATGERDAALGLVGRGEAAMGSVRGNGRGQKNGRDGMGNVKKSDRLEVEKTWSTGWRRGRAAATWGEGACTNSQQQPLNPSDQPSLAPAQDSSSIHWPSTGTARQGTRAPGAVKKRAILESTGTPTATATATHSHTPASACIETACMPDAQGPYPPSRSQRWPNT